VSRTALGPTQPTIQWVPGAISLGVKRPGREADNSPPSSAEVKMRGAIPPLPKYAFMAWCLVKHRDNFTFLQALEGRIRYLGLLMSRLYLKLALATFLGTNKLLFFLFQTGVRQDCLF
jgi:hypothetical protein